MQVLAEAYISLNFRCRALIWMFCGKMSDNRIVETHYRTLRAICDTQARSYEELLHLSRTKKSLTQNFQILILKVHKCLNNISPPFTWNYFNPNLGASRPAVKKYAVYQKVLFHFTWYFCTYIVLTIWNMSW